MKKEPNDNIYLYPIIIGCVAILVIALGLANEVSRAEVEDTQPSNEEHEIFEYCPYCGAPLYDTTTN